MMIHTAFLRSLLSSSCFYSWNKVSGYFAIFHQNTAISVDFLQLAWWSISIAEDPQSALYMRVNFICSDEQGKIRNLLNL